MLWEQIFYLNYIEEIGLEDIYLDILKFVLKSWNI
jgi:hypothetical protein